MSRVKEQELFREINLYYKFREKIAFTKILIKFKSLRECDIKVSHNISSDAPSRLNKSESLLHSVVMSEIFPHYRPRHPNLDSQSTIRVCLT